MKYARFTDIVELIGGLSPADRAAFKIRDDEMAQAGWNGTKANYRAHLIELKRRLVLDGVQRRELDMLEEEFGQYQDSIAPLRES